MTQQQIDAMKLALEALMYASYEDIEYDDACAAKVLEARNALKESLSDYAMQEVQRLEQEPYSVQQAYAMAQVCLDLHEAIGCKWGDNVYFAIDQLKAAAHPPQRTEQEPVADYIAARDMLDAKPVPPRTWVGLTDDEKNDCLVSADPCEALAEPEARQLIEDVEQALKERNQ